MIEEIVYVPEDLKKTVREVLGLELSNVLEDDNLLT